MEQKYNDLGKFYRYVVGPALLVTSLIAAGGGIASIPRRISEINHTYSQIEEKTQDNKNEFKDFLNLENRLTDLENSGLSQLTPNDIEEIPQLRERYTELSRNYPNFRDYSKNLKKDSYGKCVGESVLYGTLISMGVSYGILCSFFGKRKIKS